MLQRRAKRMVKGPAPRHLLRRWGHLLIACCYHPGWGKAATGLALALTYLLLSAATVATVCNYEHSQAVCTFDCSSAGESIDVLEMDVMLLQPLGFSKVTLSQAEAAPQQVREAGDVWKVSLGGSGGAPGCSWGTCSPDRSLCLGHPRCPVLMQRCRLTLGSPPPAPGPPIPQPRS